MSLPAKARHYCLGGHFAPSFGSLGMVCAGCAKRSDGLPATGPARQAARFCAALTGRDHCTRWAERHGGERGGTCLSGAARPSEERPGSYTPGATRRRAPCYGK